MHAVTTWLTAGVEDRIRGMARLFVGEGCVLVARHKGSYFCGYNHALKVLVRMGDKAAVEDYLFFKGTIRYIPPKLRENAIWEWNAHGYEAKDMLRCILPFVVGSHKEMQVRWALIFPIVGKGCCITDEIFKFREGIYHELRQLKAVNRFRSLPLCLAS